MENTIKYFGIRQRNDGNKTEEVYNYLKQNSLKFEERKPDYTFDMIGSGTIILFGKTVDYIFEKGRYDNRNKFINLEFYNEEGKELFSKLVKEKNWRGYTKYRYTDNEPTEIVKVATLQALTRNKLESLSKKFGIKFEKTCRKWLINGNERKAKSILVKGRDKEGNPVEYWMYYSPAWSSGMSFVWHKGRRYQAHILLTMPDNFLYDDMAIDNYRRREAETRRLRQEHIEQLNQNFRVD